MTTWKTQVIPVSIGLEETGYAHQVVIHGEFLPMTVTHHRHRNYDHIHTEDIGNGYVRQTGIGKRTPDLTPHYLARLVAAAPTMLDYIATRASVDADAKAIIDGIGQPSR